MLHRCGNAESDCCQSSPHNGNGFRSELTEYARHLIYRFIGLLSLTRRLEWPSILE